MSAVSTDSEQLVQFLKNVKLFAELGPESLNKLAACLKTAEFPAWRSDRARGRARRFDVRHQVGLSPKSERKILAPGLISLSQSLAKALRWGKCRC